MFRKAACILEWLKYPHQKKDFFGFIFPMSLGVKDLRTIIPFESYSFQSTHMLVLSREGPRISWWCFLKHNVFVNKDVGYLVLT